ncbi:hypothetical protein C8Q79DRAFT_1009226 [Trametes meyenii]|nr:hypothetical protein C8Q79DRAFT_1009226 [Trametes meyenii]
MNVTADNTVAQVALVKQVVIDLATQFRDENNFNLAVFVTVFYDYLTTLDREVRLLWGRKISLGKGIFLLNRYTSLLLFLMSFVELFPFGKGVRYMIVSQPHADDMLIIFCLCHTSCVALTYTWATLAILMHIVRVAFSGVRIYAISSQNVIITWIVVLLGMAPVGANIYLFSHLESVTLLGCLPVPNISLDSMNT